MAMEGVYAIKPPRLEDAGLEDTALSQEGIQEAFKIAAQRVKGTARDILSKIVVTDDESDGKPCAGAPLPIYAGLGDVLVEGDSGSPKEGSCIDPSKGGLVEEGHDEVVDKTGDAQDKLVQGEEAGPKLGQAGCIKGDEEFMAVEQREAERKAKAAEKEKTGRDEDAPGLIEAAI